VEEVHLAPEQVFEVGLEARVLKGRDQGVEDVGEGSGDVAVFGERPGVGSSWKGRKP